MNLSSLAHAPAIDCRPMDLSLRLALIAMDIELCLLGEAGTVSPSASPVAISAPPVASQNGHFHEERANG